MERGGDGYKHPSSLVLLPIEGRRSPWWKPGTVPWFRMHVMRFPSDKSDISGIFEDDDDAGCTRCRCAMARIGSDREARSETREGACSPRASIDSGLLGEVFLGGARVFQREKSVIIGFYEGFRFKVSGFRVP